MEDHEVERTVLESARTCLKSGRGLPSFLLGTRSLRAAKRLQLMGMLSVGPDHRCREYWLTELGAEKLSR